MTLQARGGKDAARPSKDTCGGVRSPSPPDGDMTAGTEHLEHLQYEPGASRRQLRFVRLPSFFAVVAFAVAAISLHLWTRKEESPLDQLLAVAAAEAARPLEARLSSGFTWAPAGRPAHRSAVTLLRNTAASALDTTRSDRSLRRRHTAALAYLLLERAEDAAKLLNPAAPKKADAQLWSDLAAAHYHIADTMGEPRTLGKALTAADAALRLDARLPEALFNRALVLQRLGLRELAREAWQRFLEVERTGRWASEARERLGSLQPLPVFADVLQKNYDRMASDAAAADAFARAYPQEARTWGETKILGRWAAVELAGQHEDAAKHLRVARELGNALARLNGDRMLLEAVASIDRAAAPERALLANGHVAFHDGQAAYRVNKAATAHPLFVRAADELARGGSPVALVARYFVANTTYDAGRVRDAFAIHEQLLATAAPQFAAHRAQLQWQLGRAYALDGRWGEALDVLAAGAAGFERLGERNYAAIVRGLRAEVYDWIGDPRNAWQERMSALEELGRHTTPRLVAAMSSMSYAALAAGEWEQAASYLELELELCRRAATPIRWIELLLARAQLRRRLGDSAGARADLAGARAEIGRLNDASLSSLMEEEAVVIEAQLAPPPEAIQLLTRAVESYEPRGRRVFLPAVLLQRGRAYASLGDRARARADFDKGIVELEAGREALPEGESRWGILGSVDELFDDAIALALADGDAATAFAYAERARARQLGDALDADPAGAVSDMPADTAIVEYVALEDRLIIFVRDRAGIRAFQQPVTRAQLADRAARFAKAIRKNDLRKTRLGSAALHRLLLEPFVAQIGASRLVIVPDNVLSGVAFAALAGADGRFLIESRRVVVSPSAAVFLRLAARPPAAEASPRLLLVANPSRPGGEEEPLPFTEREAEGIGRLYPRATMLSRSDATVSAFMREAPSATIIHFAGHAIAGGGSGTALLLAEADKAADRVDASFIAAMRLRSTTAVVLAACDTANGEIRGREGTISLARAFLAAGVPSVIATVQPIDDREAAQFFARVHHYLTLGYAPADALRATQIEWVHRPGTEIATWAAVQLMGS